MRVGRSDALNDGSPKRWRSVHPSPAGTLLISTGGTAISGFIGGTAIVEAGGVALDLEFGGVLNLSSGGTDQNHIQSLETVENVSPGNRPDAAVIFGSQIFSGGEAEDASVFGSLAVQTVFSGGTAVRSQLIADPKLRAGCSTFPGARRSAAHVLAGSAIVQALGVALGIGVGGTLKLSAGGTAIDADFDEGLEQIFSGGTDIRGSIFEASQTIFAGGNPTMPCSLLPRRPFRAAASRCERSSRPLAKSLCWRAAHRCKRPCSIDRSRLWRGERSERWSKSGGRINVSGGVASATILSSGGTATIGKGGTAIGSLVAGGSQIVGSGGIASATRVGNAGFDHGEETVSAGGRAIGTVVTVGDQTVLAGGIASGTTAGNAPLIIGKQIVARGGLAVGTIVKFQQEVASGGTTSATTIDADGVTIVSSGGVIKGLTDLSGILVLESGAKISTEVEFGDGGDLIISGQTVSAGLLLDAFDETDYIDLASVPFVPGGTAFDHFRVYARYSRSRQTL